MRTRLSFIIASSLLSLLVALPLAAEKPAKGQAAGSDEFFIITSVDMSKNELVLKHPTEVTELMLVSAATACSDEKGKSMPCNKLRAGDTVFVFSQNHGSGPRTALRIRLGAMTVDEVHRKYMNPQ
jgi:hypothetical protein